MKPCVNCNSLCAGKTSCEKLNIYRQGKSDASATIAPMIREIHDGVYVQGKRKAIIEYARELKSRLSDVVILTDECSIINLIDEVAEECLHKAEQV